MLGRIFGLGGDTTSVKTTALVSGETKVLGEEVTLVGTVEGGLLSYSKGQGRVIDRFRLGGNVMRGFELVVLVQGSMMVRASTMHLGETDLQRCVWKRFSRLELKNMEFLGGFFYDAGNLWGLKYDNVYFTKAGSWRQAAASPYSG